MAKLIASKGRVSVIAGKEAVNAAYETTLAEGLRLERRLFHGLFATADQKEGECALRLALAAAVQRAECKNVDGRDGGVCGEAKAKLYAFVKSETERCVRRLEKQCSISQKCAQETFLAPVLRVVCWLASFDVISSDRSIAQAG